MRILVLNGPNINMLGIRQPEIYGNKTYCDLCEYINLEANKMNISVDIRQSNYEGQIVDWIQTAPQNYDGIVINPAAYTHYSIAILDALKAIEIPIIEVHISDISKREDFRKISVTKEACVKQIAGHGFDGYIMAIKELYEYIEKI